MWQLFAFIVVLLALTSFVVVVTVFLSIIFSLVIDTDSIIIIISPWDTTGAVLCENHREGVTQLRTSPSEEREETNFLGDFLVRYFHHRHCSFY